MSRQQIYCGNNLYEVGNRRIGTPYECLKKGIGQGRNSDLTGFNPNYQAIIADNTYCGTGTPPAGKQMGTPTSCLRKGVGIGKKLQYERGGNGGGDGDGGGDGNGGGDGDGGGQLPPPTAIPLLPRPGIVAPQRGLGGWKVFLLRWWPVHLSITDCTNQPTTSTAIIVRRMVVYVALKMAATTPTRSANITGHHLKRNTFHPPNPL